MNFKHLIHRCRQGFTLIELMIAIAIIAILAAILVPNFSKARAQAHLTACKSNIRNMATACEMYAINHDGRYPSALSDITVGSTGAYMKFIPSCPACGYDTYTGSYAYAANPDAFTVRCGGANHVAVDVPEGYPLYSNFMGLSCYGENGDFVVVSDGSSGSKVVTSDSNGSPGGTTILTNDVKKTATDIPSFDPSQFLKRFE